MTFAKGTKVRYASTGIFKALDGIEGVVVEPGEFITRVAVTKVVDSARHGHLIGRTDGFTASNLVAVGDELKEGGTISYGQVERGQRIRVSYESKGVTRSREGIVGKVSNNRAYTQQKENWTINFLDLDARGFAGTGSRLNWGSANVTETIVLLENVPEVDALLERLLESKGGTLIRTLNQFFVREPFSDCWKSLMNQCTFTSEFVRNSSEGDIVFYVEDKEGN